MYRKLNQLMDFLFGRPQITIIKEKILNNFHVKPIFIIGVFRSGTTLLRLILDSHSNICCPPETKFLEPLSSLYYSESSLRALNFMGFDEQLVKKQIKKLADVFFVGYMVAQNKKRWADKTPDYVRILDFIEWLYGPDCKYILIYRNGLDVAYSICQNDIKKMGGNTNIEKAFEYWRYDSEIMTNWKKKYPDRCYEMRYEDLCTHPMDSLMPLFEFLEEKWEEDVMNWYKNKHDHGYEDPKTRWRRGFKLSFANFNKLPDELMERFKKKGATLHKKMGYDPETLKPCRKY